MRRSIPATFLLLATACGGNSTPTSVVTPPTPGAPASLAIVSGDGQSAVPGSVLPAKVSVLVKDAAGVAVPGVAVHFTVDSGGGSIGAATATTGSDGVAVGGSWTLGSAAGTNVISASVVSLAPVRFHAEGLGPAARPLVTNTVVGMGGGTITYSHIGDPLSGLTITVPAAAYPTATTWSVTADSSVLPTLPAGFSQVGPTLIIGNGQDFADSVMTLTMPMHLAQSETVAPFYYDPASGTLEGIPIVSGTDSTVTLATKHFTSDEMVIPGTGASLSVVRSSLRLGFGNVRIVWVRTGTAGLVGTWSSTFLPGVDDWEFTNYGDYISPLGDCEGMSITTMFYHYYFHPNGGGGGLYHRYDQSLANQWDNVQGIRFAGSIQGDYSAHVAAGSDQIAALSAQAAARGTPAKFLTSTWILLTVKLTGQPVLMSLRGPGGGHAVVAYSASSDGTSTQVSFSDPNRPGLARVMTFQSGVLDPILLSANAASGAEDYTMAFALSVSAQVPLRQISTRWAEFVAKTAGSDRYPASYHFEVYDDLHANWVPLGSTVQTTAAQLQVRTICPSCPVKTVGGATDEQVTNIWDGAGATRLSPDGSLPNAAGTKSYLAVARAYSPNSPTNAGFVDYQAFTVSASPFSIDPTGNGLNPDTPIRLVSRPGPLATAGSTYTWSFNDGTQPIVVHGDSIVTHTFTKIDVFTAIVVLADANGHAVARTTTDVTILPAFKYVITPPPTPAAPGVPATLTATVQGPLPSGGLPSTMKFSWSITVAGNPGAVDIETTTPTLVYTFPSAGVYTVFLFVDFGGKLDAVPYTMAPDPITLNLGSSYVQFAITGGWDPSRMPPDASYQFTDYLGGRAAPGVGTGNPAVQGLYIQFDNTPDAAVGFLLGMFVTTGAPFHQGDVFTLAPQGVVPSAGQFALLLNTNLNNVADPASRQYNVVGSGTCTITSLAQLLDGTFVAHFSFSISNGGDGTIAGIGVATWK